MSLLFNKPASSVVNFLLIEIVVYNDLYVPAYVNRKRATVRERQMNKWINGLVYRWINVLVCRWIDV
jgi:hypothetical protein